MMNTNNITNTSNNVMNISMMSTNNMINTNNNKKNEH